MNVNEFEGRTAVVTGAASGIGLALAEGFVREGMRVVLADIEKEALDVAVMSLRDRDYEVTGIVTDTMDKESVTDLLSASTSAYGAVHILCNNAGVVSGGPDTPGRLRGVWELPDEDWRWVMGVNFWGVLHGIQVFVPHMLAHGQPAQIVNTCSLMGLIPSRGPYGVSKHGVLALTENLYQDLKDARANVSATLLCPGFVKTKIFDAERNRPGDLATGMASSNEVRQMLKTLVEEGMEPFEIADAVLNSIKADQFYVLPHPAWDDFIRKRVECILARKEPAVMDVQEIAVGRAHGEIF
jgi:NAD(P)-dependent dehydrogenase (short-subunit alcohol dehydrogenase family)